MKTISLVRIAFLATILIVSKELLSFLPNIELVSLLVIIYSKLLVKEDSYLVVVLFVLVQGVLYGFGDWMIGYFISWPLLVFLTRLLKNHLNTYLRIAIFSGIFGLCFGIFFTLPYLMVSLNYAVGYYIKGIFFDGIHAIGNFIIAVLLYDPLYTVLLKLTKQWKLSS